MGKCGKVWEDVGKCGKMWESVGRCGKRCAGDQKPLKVCNFFSLDTAPQMCLVLGESRVGGYAGERPPSGRSGA